MRYDPPFHKSNGLVPAIFAVLALVVFPFFFDTSYIRHLMILGFVFAIVAVSWDLSLGFGGLFNFSHVALFAVGIYTYGILTKTYGVDPWVAILLAGFVAMLFASIIVLPVLRLDGIYVILVTIAFSQIIYQFVISQSQITGGTGGMVTLPALSIDDYRFTKNNKIGYYYTGLVLLILSAAGIHLITRSKLGRAIIALRDNKYYAMSRGVSEWKTRLATLTFSAFFAGIAGGFYGSYVRVASPDIFGVGSLTLILSMLLVGGLATIWGPICTAFLLIFVSEVLADLGPIRDILIASLIIAVMVFYPGGLWGVIQEFRELTQTIVASMRVKFRRTRQQLSRANRMNAPEVMLKTTHGQIAVVDTGISNTHSGPPILMIHGNSACKEAFYNQFEYFRADHRLVAFDLPGHGMSDNGDPEEAYNIPAYADVAEEVLTALNVEMPVVLGWSLGGYVALELTARSPEKYSGLAITGTSPLNIVPDDFAKGYDADSHLVLSGKQYFTKEEERNYAGSATAPYSPSSAFLHENINRTDGRTRFYMITKLSVVNWPRQMRMLREGLIPFAIMNGSNDPFLNHSYIAKLQYGNIWKAKPTDIPNGAHAPFFNKPNEFNKEFAEFIHFCVQPTQKKSSIVKDTAT
jgi:ABC-type branched-subunit amino acid transport system permease subunit/pimeloyl-ACP methyl ester carboxylesterase